MINMMIYLLKMVISQSKPLKNVKETESVSVTLYQVTSYIMLHYVTKISLYIVIYPIVV